jgi:DNA mismatch endonuclease, patch repair protein
MTDVHTIQQRSFNMSRIRSSNTKPELLVRHFLFAQGYRYRINVKNLPGKPDIVLPKHRTIIFVHGCFWHGHANCKYFKIPQTRTEWWTNKINTNKANDTKAIKALKKEKWSVIIIWTCKLRVNLANSTLKRLLLKLNDDLSKTPL